jgi:hypothetical protein
VSLAFRIIALLLLVAIFLPSGAAEYDRLLVVALDGASKDHIDVLIERGELPTLAAMRSGGVSADLSGGSSRSPHEYWSRVFGVGIGAGGEPSSPVWASLDAAGRRVVLVNVPTELVEHRDLTQVGLEGLPGADDARGFVGDSTGRVADASVVSRGRVEWPYREASREIVAATDSLAIGESTDWVDVQQSQPDGRSGRFRVYRLDDDTYYLTPVYRRTYEMPPATVASATSSSLAGDSELYVADDASSTASSARVLDYLLPHASDISRDRAEAARRLATGAWQMFVHYDPLLTTAYQVQAGLLDSSEEGGVPTAADLSEQYEQVDAQIGRMLEAAGPGTLLVVLTREPAASLNGDSAGGLMMVGLGGNAVSEAGSESSVAPTFLDLAAVDLRPGAAGRALHAVAARYRSSSLPVSVPRSESQPAKSFAGSADTLRRLGGLVGSVSIPAPRDVDASVAP